MDSISLIKTPIEAELEDFKALFDTPLSDSNALLDSVITHIRKRNGKMMRPILVLLVARLYGAVTPATLHAAVSLELLHTASLLLSQIPRKYRIQLTGSSHLFLILQLQRL